MSLKFQVPSFKLEGTGKMPATRTQDACARGRALRGFGFLSAAIEIFDQIRVAFIDHVALNFECRGHLARID